MPSRFAREQKQPHIQPFPVSIPAPHCRQPVSTPHIPRGEATSLARTYTVGWRRASLTARSPSTALNTKVFPSIHLSRSKRDSTDVGNAAMPAQGFASLPWLPASYHPTRERRDCRPHGASPRLDPGQGADFVRCGAIWWQKQAALVKASQMLHCFAPFIFSNWMHALGGCTAQGWEEGGGTVFIFVFPDLVCLYL